jgi:hypothetical protein
MSDPDDDRQSALTQRRWVELLHALEHEHLRAEDERRKLRSQREEALRQWFARHLETTNPQPGQRHDTLLGEYIGQTELTKMATLTLPIASLQPLRDGGWLLEARGKVAATLQKAFRKLAKRALGQMANHELPPAGAILAADVDEVGNASVSARITDETVAAKVQHAVYPLVRVASAGGEVLGVEAPRPADAAE